MEKGDRTRDRGRPRDCRRTAGMEEGTRRRAIRYSYPGQGNRSLLGKTRVAVEGPFHFPRGCRRRLLSARKGAAGTNGTTEVEGKFAVLRSGLRDAKGRKGEREQFFFPRDRGSML